MAINTDYNAIQGVPGVQKVNETSAVRSTSAATDEKKVESSQKTPQQDTYTETKKTGINRAVVAQMKSDLEAQKTRFFNTVKAALGNQAQQFGQNQGTGLDGLNIQFGQGAWKGISEEDMAVLQKDAQAAIADDGYWGVDQTSERLITFAKALVGDNPARAEEMRAAFIKGYQAVEKIWGSKLPDVSQRTYDKVMKSFDDWAGKTTEPSTAKPSTDTVVKNAEKSAATDDDVKREQANTAAAADDAAKKAAASAANGADEVTEAVK